MRHALPAVPAILLALTACATPRGVQHVRPVLGALPPAERAPVRLALRIDPAFSKAWLAHHPGAAVVPVGEDGAGMIDEVAPLLAEGVERFGAPARPGAPPFDFVLEPALERFDFFEPQDEPGAAHAIALRMSLFEPDGRLVSTWTVEGRAPIRPPSGGGAAAPAALSTDGSGAGLGGPARAREDGLVHARENLAAAARALVAGFRRDSRLEEYRARRAAGESLALPGVEVEAVLADFEVVLPGVVPSLYQFGLVPVRVRIANRGATEVRLSGLVARLELADGRVLHAPDASLVTRRLELISQVASVRKIGYGSLIGGIAMVAHQVALRAQLPVARALLEERALRAGTLAPGGVIEGHLYFLPQYGRPPEGAATVSVWVADGDLHTLRSVTTLALPARAVKAAPEPAGGDT